MPSLDVIALWICFLLVWNTSLAFHPHTIGAASSRLRSKSHLVLNRRSPSLRRSSLKLTTNNNPSPDDDDKDNHNEYRAFLDRNELRKVVQNCPTFSNLSPLDVERVVQLSTIVPDIPAGDYVFRKGDPADALYFCRSGAFEVVLPTDDDGDEATGIRIEPGGGYFGELGLLFGQPRGASVRAAASENVDDADGDDDEKKNSLWRLDKELFQAIMTAEQKRSAISTVQQDDAYEGYLSKINLQKTVQKCPLFKSLDEADVQRVIDSMTQTNVAEGDNIITQGDLGDAMYFVESGSFECYNQGTGEVVAIVEKGGYFGELSLLFDQERAVSVRASTPNCKVWVVSAVDFDAAIETSNLSGQLLDYYQEKYKGDNVWKTLLKLKPTELFELAQQASRPKKKKVSFHSTLSVMVAGALIPIYLQFWNPTWKGVVGTPQLYDFLSFKKSVGLLRFGTIATVFSGFLGVFRFPRRTPRSRLHIFATMTALMIVQLFGSLSNCFGNSWYLFDAWSWPARLSIGATMLGTMLLNAKGMNVMIAEEKDAGMTEQMNPMFETRTTGLLATWIFAFATYVVCSPLCVIMESKAKFESVALPVFVATGFDVWKQFNSLATNVYLSMGALYATLQYEKRIKPWQSILLLALTFNLCGSTESGGFFLLLQRNELFVPIHNYYAAIFQKYNLAKYYFGFFILATLNGFRNVWAQKRQSLSS